MLGVLVNTLAVLAGGLLGLLLKKGLADHVEKAVMTGLGICVAVIGIQGALDGCNTLVMVISIAVGIIFGELLDIDRYVNRAGQWVERRFRRPGSDVSLAEGFVGATLLFCTGAMAVVGSLNSGLRGDHSMLFVKSLLDFFSSIMLSVSLGVGVALSAAAILVYQGAIALLSGVLEPLLNAIPGAVTQLGCVGSIAIIAIGLNLAGITKIKVANFLPCLVLAPVVTWVMNLFG